MKRSVVLACLFALFLLVGRTVAQPMGAPEVKITSTAPGTGTGMIDAEYTYKNVPNAKSVRMTVYNPPNPAVSSVSPLGANGKGTATTQTAWFNTAVEVEIELLDAKGQAFLKSNTVDGKTK